MPGTAVIYARFSCSRQREASIEDQLRVCEEWCSREGYRIVERYCDYAVSGRTDERPEFQRMVANAGESDIVLVYMMDRFSRDVYDAPIYKKKLRDKGVRVVSATEAMPDGPEAILIESIYEAMAAMESAHTSRRVRRGMEGNALKCMHNGVRLFGYSFGDDGRYVVNEDEAVIVREVFARKAAGEAVNSIAADLARRGVRPYSGKPASYGFVYNMLGKEKYAGVYTWGDVRVEDGMPAIVTKEEFAMAQMVKPRRKRGDVGDWGEFPLSGKSICGGCGRNLTGTSGHGRHGAKYEYYKCSNGCGLKPVRCDWLEPAIVGAVRGLLSDREKALDIARAFAEQSRNEDAEARLAQARRRKKEADDGIDRLMDAVAAGLDVEIAKAKLDELKVQAEVAGAEVRIQERAVNVDVEDFANFLQFGATLDDAAVLDAFIAQVWVSDEEVVVSLNYNVAENMPERLTIKRGSSNFALGSYPQAEEKPEPGQTEENLVRANSSWWSIGGSNP